MHFIITLDDYRIITIEKNGVNSKWYYIHDFKLYKRKFLRKKFMGNIVKLCVVHKKEGHKNAKNRRNRD